MSPDTRAPHARGANVNAIAEATGHAWDDWCRWLGEQGAAERNHAGIAELAVSRLRGSNAAASSNPEWWAQAVTVAYEQHVGRRAPGQKNDGSFDANASKTVAGDMDAALARVREVFGSATDEGTLNGVALAEQPSTSATEKWRYWRVSLADGTRVDVTVQTKPGTQPPKSTVAVGHSRIGSAEAAAAWKSWWKTLLGTL
ncbi:MAG: hypothetical protein Q4G34_07110 [Micrococcus sp.]|nr:hypothetical protein [Micrococcus sp.]